MMNSNSEQKTKLLSLYSDKKLESSKKINLEKKSRAKIPNINEVMMI